MDRVKKTDHVAWNTAVSIVTTGHTDVSTITGGAQTITGGPVASQEVIKELGTKRRRLLQRQQRPPVREPDRLNQLDRAVPYPRHLLTEPGMGYRRRPTDDA